MKFDTRDKKPKLYSVLILTAAAALVIAGVMLWGGSGKAAAVCIVFDLYLAGVLALLVTAFFRQIGYNPYSYNTIFYFGFALFVLTVLATHILLTVMVIKSGGVIDEKQIIYRLMFSAKNYMLISAPFILVFAGALCVSNISLIRHEGIRLVNVLGILLSLFLVGGELFLFRYDYYVTGSQREVMIHDLISNTFAAMYLYFECMVLGSIAAGAITATHEPERNKDFVIILGCGMRKDGTPTPLMRGRVERALAFYRRQKEETGKELIFVTSGGRGANEPISESAAMKNYLISQGVPASQIIEEDRSTDTYENMAFSKRKIEEADPNAKVAFSTTNFHVFRSGLLARRVKMRAEGMGAKTKWYFWPNAAVREFVGLLTRHRFKQAAILLSLVAAYIALTLLSYYR